MNNTKVVTDTKIEVKTEATAIKPPEDFHVLLMNSEDVGFEAVFDVLSTVLQISEARAIEIGMFCNENGSAIIFTGPSDLAQTYIQALRAYALKQSIEREDGDYLGYARMIFELEKKK